MAKQGKQTLDVIKRFVIDTKRNASDLTQAQIADRVAGKFGEDARIDKSTIGRILRVAGLSTVSSVREDSALAERSGHWPGLREAATILKMQLQAPIPQLLGLPWKTAPEFNGDLTVISTVHDLRVRLKVEDGAEFGALKEHLPKHDAWKKLADWKQSVGLLFTGLNSLCEWVKEQPEVQDMPWVAPVDLEKVDHGLSEYFAMTVVMRLAESLSRDPQAMWEHKVLPRIAGSTSWVLRLEQSALYVPLAINDNRNALDELGVLHDDLLGRLAGTPELKGSLATLITKVGDDQDDLGDELSRLALLAMFPGVCSLYTVNP